MFRKRILLADAETQAQLEFCQAMGEGWDIVKVTTGTAALTAMQELPADVVVADIDLAELDGVELLNRVHSDFPKALRFIIGRETDRERMVKEVLGAHQFISKPLDGVSIKNAIERALALDYWIPRKSIRELVARIRTLPTIPSLYLEVLAALRSSDTTTEQIGAIISKDMAMTTKLLQVLNSASFGLSRKITNPSEAVGLLGFETVSSMVMTIKLLSQYDKVKPVYFSIDKLWRHSTDVARMAKQIAVWHTDDHALAEAAFTGGLMHDLGKVVLASNFDEQYRGAQSLARKQELQLSEVEREIFGASHGEIGAYLLGLWGMPIELLEVAALHENPSRSSSTEFTPLTAVHIANAFAHEMNPDKEGLPISKIDGVHLTNVGVIDYIPEWRNKLSGKDDLKTDLKTKAAPIAMQPVTRVTVPAVQPQPETFAPTLAVRKGSFAKNQWLYGSAVAVAILLLLGWVYVTGVNARIQKLAAPTVSDASITPVKHLASVTPAVQPVPVVVAKPEEIIVQNPIPAAATNPAPVIAIAPVLATPAAPDFPEVKLQGIFFSNDHPSAILNGKLHQVNDRVGEVLVVDIKRSSVTLEYQKRRKTLSVR